VAIRRDLQRTVNAPPTSAALYSGTAGGSAFHDEYTRTWEWPHRTPHYTARSIHWAGAGE